LDASAANHSSVIRPGIAERLWEAARTEFSQRGYHGARVQGIARRAGCNVALLYRHWASKKALYVDILRNVWQGQAKQVVSLLDRDQGAPAVVGAYLDALLGDALGAQILVRELLDGGPFLTQLLEGESDLTVATRIAAERMASAGNGDPSKALRPGVDPALAALTIAGLATLVASARQTAKLFIESDYTQDRWRDQLYDMLLHGLVPCPVTAPK
jgi:AcrR family transcriptional regulator